MPGNGRRQLRRHPPAGKGQDPGDHKMASARSTPVPPQMQMKLTVKNELADSESPALCVSVPLWCSSPPKLTKTDRKGRGVQNWNVVHQKFTKIKTDRPVSFPPKADTRALLFALLCGRSVQAFATFVAFCGNSSLHLSVTFSRL
jgi:hypothetical protein